MSAARAPRLIARPRARDLIVAIARHRHARRVLLPALYCGDIADGFAAAGIPHACYDVGADLGRDPEPLLSRLTPATDMVVTVHSFGLHRPPPPLPASVTVLQDACHAARTMFAMGRNGGDDSVVFSPRKEFGWLFGGIAALGASTGRGLPVGDGRLLARWKALPRSSLVAGGRVQTSVLRGELGDRMTDPESAILTHLPLRSRQRDETIAMLRAQGIAAWRWLIPPGAARARATGLPRWEALNREILFVPLTSGITAERLLTALRTLPLRPFSD